MVAIVVATGAAAPLASAHTAGARPQVRHRPGAALEMGFFEQWSIYGRGYGLAAADASGQIAHLTDLDYAFGGVLPRDGATSTPDAASNPVTCQSLDSWADWGTPYLTDVDGGSPVGADGLAGNFQQLRELKAEYPGLRVIMSLGGYTGSTFFSDAAATPASRSAFVASCIDLFVKGDLPGLAPGTGAGIIDGFDLDWEYPGNANGAPGVHHSPADGRNFALLAAQFRRQLSALGRSTGERYRLTAELPAGRRNAADIDAAALARSLDDGVVMDYDFQGPWVAKGPTNFESNLFTSRTSPDTADEPRISADSTVRYYERHGVPARKLVMGVPFYGHGWTGVEPGADHGLYQPATGPATSPDVTKQGTTLAGLDGADPAGTTDYYEVAQQPGYQWHVDPRTGATWLYNPDTKTFWSMQSPLQAYEKARYVRAHGLAGVSVWDLSGDAGDELTSVLADGLR